jgi:hypothetical protein
LKTVSGSFGMGTYACLLTGTDWGGDETFLSYSFIEPDTENLRVQGVSRFSTRTTAQNVLRHP